MESMKIQANNPSSEITLSYLARPVQVILGHEGHRILIQADPGMGKTTFTHKVALDWAQGKLPMFDDLMVVKLRELSPNQTIAQAVTIQMELEEYATITEPTDSVAKKVFLQDHTKNTLDSGWTG